MSRRVTTNQHGHLVIRKQPTVSSTVAQAREPLYYSKYWLTVSTNVSKRTVGNARSKLIGDALMDAFETMTGDRILDIVTFAPGFPSSANTIKSITVKPVLEIGPKYNRIHLHATYEIVHTTKLRVMTEDVRKVLREELEVPNTTTGIKNIYVKNVWIRSSKPLANYLAKSSRNEQQKREFERHARLRIAKANASAIESGKTEDLTLPSQQEIIDLTNTDDDDNSDNDDDPDATIGALMARFQGLDIL